MDITEMFEAHHVDIEKAEIILKKYFVKKADGPRNSQYTFSKSGFYHKLRKRVLPIWKTHKENSENIIFSFLLNFRHSKSDSFYFSTNYLLIYMKVSYEKWLKIFLRNITKTLAKVNKHVRFQTKWSRGHCIVK